MEDKISSITLRETKCYEDNIFESIWEIAEGEEDLPKNDFSHVLYSAMEKASKFVCIIADDQLPIEILRLIHSLFEKGIRVYLLTNKFYLEYRDTIVEKSLIRILDKVTGTLVLIDPTFESIQKGFITNSQSFSCKQFHSIYIPLNKEQINEAYQYFNWLFWKADTEIKIVEDIDSPRIISTSPYDLVPLLSPEHVRYNSGEREYQTNDMKQLILKAQKKIQICCDSSLGKLEELLLTQLQKHVFVEIYTKLDILEIKVLQQLATGGAVIHGFTKNHNNFLIIDESEGILISTSFSNDEDQEVFSLHLNSINCLDEYLVELNKVDRYDLFVSKKLGQVNAENVLLGNSPSYSKEHFKKISDFRKLDLGKIQAKCLRDLLDKKTKPTFVPDGFSKNVEYIWEVYPKYLEDNAVKDPLYQDWENEKIRLLEYLDSIKKKSTFLEDSKATLSEKIQTMMTKFMIGKKQNINKIISNVDIIIAEIKDTENLSRSLFECWVSKAQKEDGSLKSSEEEVQEEIEKNKQNEIWLQRKSELEESLSHLLREIKKEEDNLKDLEKDYKINKGNLENAKQLNQETLNDKVKELELLNGKYPEGEITNQNSELDVLKHVINKAIELQIGSSDKKKKNFKASLTEIKRQFIRAVGQEQYLESFLAEQQGVEKVQILKELLKEVEKDFFKDKTILEEDVLELNRMKQLHTEIQSQKQSLQKCDSDLQALQSKYETDKKKIETSIKDKVTKQQDFENKLDKFGPIFIYKPKQNIKGDAELASVIQGKKKKEKSEAQTQSQKYNLRLPNEELPKVGVLYLSNGKNRYLAIRQWSELEVGEKEAERLKAELVCDRR